MRWLLPLALLPLVGDDPPVRPVARRITVQLVGPTEIWVKYWPPLDEKGSKAIVDDYVGRTIAYHDIRWVEDEPFPGAELGRLKIAGAKLAHQGGTVILATDPHPRRAMYVLDWLGDGGEKGHQYLYSGVEELWFKGLKDTSPVESLIRDRLLERPGYGGQLMSVHGNPRRVELRATLLVPKGKETLVLKGNLPFEATVGGKDFESASADGRNRRVEVPLESTGEPIELTAYLTTKEVGPTWDFSANWKRGDKDVPIPPSQLALPWLPIMPSTVKAPEPPYRLEGGDPKKGEIVFTSEAAKCSTCHTIGGKGGAIGPNLDGLDKRDLATIYRDIAEPSAVIVPEYLTYTVARKDGQIAVGVVRAEGFDAVRVADINGKTTTIPKAEIDEMRPSTTSTMPVGLAGALGEEKMRDLLAFLRAGKK
jgi:putative heme-binding domain-containing protein